MAGGSLMDVTLRADLRLLQWQVGVLTVLVLALAGPTLWLVLRIAERAPGVLPA